MAQTSTDRQSPTGGSPGAGRRVPVGVVARSATTRPTSDLLYVLVAAVVALTLSHLPVVDVVIYPFKLFGTFVHEWAHALVTLLTGGHVVGLRVNPDLSGEEYSRGGAGLLISSAGYVGTACAGGALLLAPLRRAGQILSGIGIAVVALTLAGALVLGAAFTLTTWFWAAVFAGVTGLIGWRATPHLARLFQQFLAVELCLAAVDGLRVLDWLAINAPGVPTDATNAAHATGLPAVVWAVLWSIVGVAAIGLCAFRLVRRSLRSAAP